MKNIIHLFPDRSPKDQQERRNDAGKAICHCLEYLAVDARQHRLTMTEMILSVALKVSEAELRGDDDLADIICSALMSARADG